MNKASPVDTQAPFGNIPFIDLQAQRARISGEIDQAVLKAVHDGRYIMGPQVQELEDRLAEFCGAKHCISCSSETDSLAMVLMAQELKPEHAVFVPAFTFVATAEVVAGLPATVFMVDVLEDTFNMDPQSLKRAIEDARMQGLEPKGIIPVDLFGQPADYISIHTIAEENNLWIMADAAQGFGAKLNGKDAGHWSLATSTSFFPAKPLGCYGDGGAIFTNNDKLAAVLKSLRVHGKGTDKYDNIRVGVNARLDTLQAAILIEKLKIFPHEIELRNAVAERYNAGLRDAVKTPVLMEGATSSWAQYTLVLPDGMDRDAFAKTCKAAGVPTAVYYPTPLSEQTAYKHYPVVGGGVPVSLKLSRSVISLPMHPYLEEHVQDYIIETVKAALETC